MKPGDKGVEIRCLSQGHLAEMLAIEKAAYPLPWSEKMLASSLQKDEVWGYLLHGKLVAYAIVSYVLDEAHLLNICVHPDSAGQGIGRKMLRLVIRKAIDRRSSMMFLEVRVSNKAAISLYFSEGFNEVGIRPNYYPGINHQKEDALLMTLELSVCLKV